MRVLAVFLLAGVTTGALVGFLAGAAWAVLGLPAASPVVAAAVVMVALVLDGVGRPAPLAVRRQVPQLWGRIFGPATAALLYGARLGVGPLTILTTWHWWAAMAIAVTAGPWTGAAAGGAFHVARTATMVVAVAGAAAAMPTRMAAVQRGERRVASLGRVLVAVAVVALLAACGGDDEDASPGSTTSTTSSSETSTDVTTRRRPTSTTPTTVASTTSTTTATPEETALMELLLEDALPGFERAPDLETPDLDLAGAAALERDTEAEQALLETRRFVRGTSRAWRDDDRGVVLVTIYEFAAPAGATAYLQDGAEHLQARGAQLFDVAELPDALGFTTVDETAEGSFTGHGVAFARGARYVLVVAGSSSSGVTVDDARRVAAAQAARLP